jgi:hypothetical protein
MTHRKSVVLPLHSDREQVKIYAQRIAPIYPVYGENYDDIVEL